MSAVHLHPQSHGLSNRWLKKASPSPIFRIRSGPYRMRRAAQQVLEDHLDHCIREAVPNEQGKELAERLKAALST